MMWIVLTKLDGDPLAVSSDQLTHIIGRSGGGSSLYLSFMGSGEDGRQRVLGVKEDLPEIEARLGLTEPADVETPKKGPRRQSKSSLHGNDV